MESVLEKLKNAQDDVEVCQCLEDLAKYISSQKVISILLIKLRWPILIWFFYFKNEFDETNVDFTVGWRIDSTVIPPQGDNENSL